MKIVNEVINKYIVKYEAYDGKRFDSKEECEKYENTAFAVIEKEYLKHEIKCISEYELYGKGNCVIYGSEEFMVGIVYINDHVALEEVNRYILFNKHHSNILDNRYIGKRVVIGKGIYCNNHYDNIGYIYGTYEEIVNGFKNSVWDAIYNNENKSND